MMFYVGDGTEFFYGVPMRDMTRTEWSELDEATRKALLDAGLFSGKNPDEAEVVAEAPAKTPVVEAPAKTPAKGG